VNAPVSPYICLTVCWMAIHIAARLENTRREGEISSAGRVLLTESSLLLGSGLTPYPAYGIPIPRCRLSAVDAFCDAV
jgi:hypothetical protein